MKQFIVTMRYRVNAEHSTDAAMKLGQYIGDYGIQKREDIIGLIEGNEAKSIDLLDVDAQERIA
jgi:hypothetical protein